MKKRLRELPANATCADCGETAANAGVSRRLDEIDATDRNFVKHWSGWKNGKALILGSEPEETYPLDRQGAKWEVCGDCGCPRWHLNPKKKRTRRIALARLSEPKNPHEHTTAIPTLGPIPHRKATN